MDEKRFQEWTRQSKALGPWGIHLLDIVTGLGLLDAELVTKEGDLSNYAEVWPGSEEPHGSLEIRTLSHLWVLGAYEVARQLGRRAAADPDLFGAHLIPEIEAVKRDFERVRIPLAKQEAARRHKDRDFGLAFPHIEGGVGVVWRVGADEPTSRRQLADRLLGLLSRLTTTSNSALQRTRSRVTSRADKKRGPRHAARR